MKQLIVKFLEFNGKNLLFTATNGQIYIAIKPVCEALNIEYTRSFKNLREDSILGPALAVQPMQVPGDQLRNMTCLPERYIYGWIFSIRSESKQLDLFKRECYDILYNHFHGTMTSRKEVIRQKLRIRNEKAALQKELSGNDDFNRYQQLVAEEARLGIAMKQIEKEELQQVSDLFSSSGIDINN